MINAFPPHKTFANLICLETALLCICMVCIIHVYSPAVLYHFPAFDEALLHEAQNQKIKLLNSASTDQKLGL